MADDSEKQSRKERVIFLVTKEELDGLDELGRKEDRPRSVILRRALEDYYPKIFKKSSK
jgi:ribbon-helix-helix CopG family protein